MSKTQGEEANSVMTADLTQLGLAIYETKLKPLLEPKDYGKFVAIHVDMEDYAVAPGAGQATRALLQRHPIDGRVVVRAIAFGGQAQGPAPTHPVRCRGNPPWLPSSHEGVNPICDCPRVVVRKIGSELEYGLLARMIAGELLAQDQVKETFTTDAID